MAMRSLTEVFILMRNNSIQNKKVFDGHHNGGGRGEDRLSLVPLTDGDSSDGPHSRIPPEWVNMVEEVHYEISRAKGKLKEIKELQDRHTMRPTFDDENGSREEKIIEDTTREMTSMLNHCNRLIQHIQRSSDGRLSFNVVNSLLQTLQTLTVDFRSSQTAYLRRIQSRENNYQQYFEAFSADESQQQFPSIDFNKIDLPALERGESLTMAQLQLLEENTAVVEQREKEILHITKSIVELNSLFKDLAGFIVDQGAVVDRIDYNIEQSSVRVKQALKSVQKAETYQTKNRKMMVILILAGIVTLLLVILIIVKS